MDKILFVEEVLRRLALGTRATSIALPGLVFARCEPLASPQEAAFPVVALVALGAFVLLALNVWLTKRRAALCVLIIRCVDQKVIDNLVTFFGVHVLDRLEDALQITT